MGISDHLKINLQEDKLKLFNKSCTGISEGKKRELELGLFKPEVLKKEKKFKTEKNKLYVKLFFNDEKEFFLFDKYFKVLKYIDNNVSNINLILSMLNLLERKKIKIKNGELRICKKKSKKKFVKKR